MTRTIVFIHGNFVTRHCWDAWVTRYDHQVVIYARADAWYIQPHSHTFHPIGADGSWSSWTHTGSSYAALVVRPGFDAYTRLDVLPQVGSYVVARTIVEGVRR